MKNNQIKKIMHYYNLDENNISFNNSNQNAFYHFNKEQDLWVIFLRDERGRISFKRKVKTYSEAIFFLENLISLNKGKPLLSIVDKSELEMKTRLIDKLNNHSFDKNKVYKKILKILSKEKLDKENIEKIRDLTATNFFELDEFIFEEVMLFSNYLLNKT